MNSPVNILFTSAGRRVELVKAFKEAYRALDMRGSVVGTDVNPLAPALHVVDRPYLVPRYDSADYVPTLVELCRQESIAAVFPLIDPDIPILSESASAFASVGAHVATVSAEASRIVSDKWLTYGFFKRLGIPTPASWLPDDVPAEAEYPLFLKPRFGSASKHTFKLRNPEDLRFFSSYVDQPIVQEYLPGSEITNDVVCDMEGQLLSVISRKRLEVRGGEVVKGVTLYDARIADYCAEIARDLSTRGPITVQCMLKDNQPYFTEVNARFGGGIPLSIASGVDSPKLLLARLAGVALDVPPVGAYRTGLYVSRFDDAFFIDETTRDAMASRRL